MFFLRPDFHLHGFSALAVAAAILAAESIRVWAVGYAGSATRTRGDKVNELVVAGPYRHVRNPLYVANILLYTLCAVLFGFLYLSIAIFIFSCLQYTFIVAFEEEILGRTFGAKYAKFCAEVPRWFISALPRCEGTGHHFELKRALRSERSTFYSILAMAILFFVKTRLGWN